MASDSDRTIYHVIETGGLAMRKFARQRQAKNKKARSYAGLEVFYCFDVQAAVARPLDDGI